MKEIYYDELTGVYNRKFLYYWIDNEIKRANRFATKFALLLLDIDNFRDINNTYGHLEGDKVLIEFTRFLRSSVREVDSLVRYGGDEFIILVPNTDMKGILDLAQRIIVNLNSLKMIGHTILCSIGFAIFPDDGMTIETLISKADNLMYQAKKEGKNQIGLKPEVVKKLIIPSPVTIGREDEANWCLSKLKEYKTIFIAGEAGIGKTRLTHEIKNRFMKASIMRGNSYAALSSVPYHPFKNLFRGLVTDEFTVVQEILKKMPLTQRSEVMKFFPDESALKTTMVDDLDKYSLFNSISLFFMNMAQSLSPLTIILLIDDLHWTDRSSCELLDFLMRNIKENVYIFGTYRVEEIKQSQISEFFGLWAREKLYTQLALSPLNQNQLSKLLEAMMGTVPPALARFVYQQGGGNPFYTEEIMRELERQKKIYWNGKEWVFMHKEGFVIPSSIEETILRKLNLLDRSISQFLEIAAVFGQEFNAEFLALVSKRNVGEVLDALDELTRTGLIKERARDIFFFSEDIVRQIAYHSISRADSAKLHRDVGAAIESYYHTNLPEYYEQLTEHFSRATDVSKILHYSELAALKARDHYAHKVAIKFYEHCLHYEDNIEKIYRIKFAIAEIAHYAGEYKLAMENLLTCLNINPNDHKVYEKLGQICENTGNFRESATYYRRGLELVKGSANAYTFKSALAFIQSRFGHFKRTQKECEAILKNKRSVNKKDLAVTYVTAGIAHQNLGEFDRARKYLHEGLMLRQALADKKGIAACYLNLAIINEHEFKIRESEELYNKALELYEEIGYQQGILITLLDLGVLHVHFDLAKAEEYYQKALAKAKLIGAKRNLAYIYNNQGWIYFRRLMFDQAMNNYRLAIQYVKETDFAEGHIFTNLNLSELCREMKQVRKGLAAMKVCYAYMKKVDVKSYYVGCFMEEIDYALMADNIKRARSLIARLNRQVKSEHDYSNLVYADILRAKVSIACRKYAAARRQLDKAWDRLKSLPASDMAAEILFLKGLALKREGNDKKALTMFLGANRMFETVGDLRFLDKIEKEIVRSVK